jgi:Predicted hydrolase of the HAD superfamily
MQVKTLVNISISKLQQLNKKVVTIDADNTLFLPKIPLNRQDVQKATNFIQQLLAKNFFVIVISNNFSTDRKEYLEQLGINSIFFAKKPLPFGFKKAFDIARKNNPNLQKQDFVHIGDQLLTDVFGAKIFGIDYISVEPLDPGHDLWYAKPSRLLERIIKKEGR